MPLQPHIYKALFALHRTKFSILSQQVQRKVMHIKHLKEKDQKRAIPTFSKVSNHFSYFTSYMYNPSVLIISSTIIPD